MISFCKSANYLTTYERDYKSGLLVGRRTAKVPVARQFKSLKNNDKKLLLKGSGQAAAAQ